MDKKLSSSQCSQLVQRGSSVSLTRVLCDSEIQGGAALQNVYALPVWDTKDNGQHLLLIRQGRDYMA